MSLERLIASAIALFRREHRKEPRGPGRSHRRPSPRLEILEARELLAVFTVTKTADDGTANTLRWAI